MLISLGKFFEIPSDFTVWQLINSQFLATAVGAIVAILVAKYGAKTAAAVTDAAVAQEASNATQKAQQLETQEGPEVADPAAAGGGEDHRERARALVAQAKDFIDSIILEDGDGRHHRTYTAIGKTDYIARAVALAERDQISESQLEGAAKFFAEWKQYERGRAAQKRVPNKTYENMSAALDQLRRIDPPRII